jgi:hypothetical protein
VLDGLSIGFRTRKATQGTKPGEPARTLTEIDLVEVSIVTFPANPKARVTAAKTLAAADLRDLEDLLGDRGLSRKTRETAVSVFREWLQRDAEQPESTLGDPDVAAIVGGDADALSAEEAAAKLLASLGTDDDTMRAAQKLLARLQS